MGATQLNFFYLFTFWSREVHLLYANEDELPQIF